jgi:hypothetical protein
MEDRPVSREKTGRRMEDSPVSRERTRRQDSRERAPPLRGYADSRHPSDRDHHPRAESHASSTSSAAPRTYGEYKAQKNSR